MSGNPQDILSDGFIGNQILSTVDSRSARRGIGYDWVICSCGALFCGAFWGHWLTLIVALL